jgi:cell division septation protein DedD
MADEGFHEIQLGKKQLFFAGMAAALYSVVVFSLGVWVGQDVRRPESEIAADAAPDAPADSTPEPTQIAPNELDYAARLQSDDKAAPAAEPSAATRPDAKTIEPPSPPDTEAQATANAAAADSAKTPPAAEKSAPAAAAPATRSTVMLQAAAFNDEKTAQSLATKLKAKGYAAFVFTAPGVPFPYKVRVGPLADKAEADRVTARLKKDEGLSPFITR